MENPTSGKPFYTTGEIARMLDLSPATIFRAIEGNKLPASTTPGGHYRVAREDLRRFLDARGLSSELLGPAGNTVLIVEDNPAELRLLKRILAGVPGVRIEATDSGLKAGYLIKSLKPGLILLDIFLREGDGREVARLVRTDPELARTRILAVTAAAGGRALREIKSSGVDGVILKPVAPAELRRKVRDLL